MKVAVITGGNRGIGAETGRQLAQQGWQVVLTGRTQEKAQQAADSINAAGHPGKAHAAQLDVVQPDQARALAEHIEQRFGRLDALVNNAGAILEARGPAMQADPQVTLRTFETNALGALNVAQALGPLLAKSGGTMVNVSSGMGGITEMGGGMVGYRLSKASLNALTRILHAELSGHGVRVNSVCPGWVQTDMGGPNATRTVAEGASGVVWAATLDKDGPSGGFFRNAEAIAW